MKLFCGDSLEVLKNLPDNSVDSIVCDPPYGISFMGKGWDVDVPKVPLWRECFRVLKPGGHMLAFFGTRTYHHGVMRIENAGFEIRDMIPWIYGSGFPKSTDVSKRIDKEAGAEREVTKEGQTKAAEYSGKFDNATSSLRERRDNPTTEAAFQWQGWGTALKPANEPICVARKPLEKDLTVAANVLKWGTGALNIDGSRIEVASDDPNHRSTKPSKSGDSSMFKMGGVNYGQNPQGRWPANVILDEEAAAMLPLDDKGLPVARFFYQAKASKRERNAGLEGMPEKVISVWGGDEDDLSEGKKSTIPRQNFHPTVKPIKLMSYLINLVTPPGGTVLDPFMGSGSTGVAAKSLGVDFIGIELDPDYFKIAEKRITSKIRRNDTE